MRDYDADPVSVAVWWRMFTAWRLLSCYVSRPSMMVDGFRGHLASVGLITG